MTGLATLKELKPSEQSSFSIEETRLDREPFPELSVSWTGTSSGRYAHIWSQADLTPDMPEEKLSHIADVPRENGYLQLFVLRDVNIDSPAHSIPRAMGNTIFLRLPLKHNR